jgi:hypothetical protein
MAKKVKIIEKLDYPADLEQAINAFLASIGNLIDIEYTVLITPDKKVYYQAYILYEG